MKYNKGSYLNERKADGDDIMKPKSGAPGRVAENQRRIHVGLKPILGRNGSPCEEKYVEERRAAEQKAWEGDESKMSFEAKKRKLANYRLSDAWRELAGRVKERDNMACVICAKERMLEVHHLTYTDVGKEPMHHLVTLCHDCHHAIHYTENNKRRKDWKKYNPSPVIAS